MRLLLVAGDPSGDLYASMLARELKARLPGLGLDAVGGPLLRAALGREDRFLEDLSSLGVTGFFEPLRRIPHFWRLLRRLRSVAADGAHAGVVCVDFYGFNRHVAAMAKRARLPVFYFISPQVWASRPGRVRALRRLVERMLVIFPFEERVYRRAGVPVTWVGHPLLDILPPARLERSSDGILRLGLLPGSRASEVRRHLPVFLGAAKRIAKDYPRMELLIFAARALADSEYEPALRGWQGPAPQFVRESDYARRARLDLALTSSGTATLENALLGIPMVVVYKLSWPTYALARALIRVPHIAMANLLAGKRLVPELVQGAATSARVAEEALALLANPDRLEALRSELAALRGPLGGSGAAGRAAEAIAAGLAVPAGGAR